MAAAHAAPRCNFYHLDGRRCGSPALRGKRRCFFHNRIRFKPERRHYPLPPLEDAASIHLALLQLARAAAEDGLTPDQGRVVALALQIAAGNLKNLSLSPDDPLAL